MKNFELWAEEEDTLRKNEPFRGLLPHSVTFIKKHLSKLIWWNCSELPSKIWKFINTG